MSEPLTRRRSLPNSLRYLAQKLDEPLTDAERAGIALTLNSLADEMDPYGAPGYVPCGMPKYSFVCQRQKGHEGSHTYRGGGTYSSWPNHLSAGPVRPDEEPTP